MYGMSVMWPVKNVVEFLRINGGNGGATNSHIIMQYSRGPKCGARGNLVAPVDYLSCPRGYVLKNKEEGQKWYC